ncbi:MAG: AfsR/SARP family transcriptional regulator [Trueperaceae bacterium]
MPERTRHAPLRFVLFGRLHIVGGDHATLELAGHEAAKLLAYLLLHRDRSHWREHLAHQLWDDGSTRDSLKHLRHALWKLHTAVPVLRSLVRAEREWIHFDAPDAWIDVAAFERAFAEARDRPGFDLDPDCANRLSDAAGLYTGDLLIGWDAEWCALERERLQNVYLLLLDKLMDHALQHALPEVGLGYGAASLAVDPARESTHQRLMGLHYLSGNRTAALRQYGRCVRRLWDDLVVRPGRRTESLREAIEADRGDQVLTSLRSRSLQVDEPAAEPSPSAWPGGRRAATRLEHPNQPR